MRVHELAKEVGCSSKELIDFLSAEGLEVANHMAMLEDFSIDLVRAHFASGEEDVEPVALQPIPKAPIHLGSLSELLGVPSSEIILALLKKGKVFNKNQELPVEVLYQLAQEFGFELVANQEEEKEELFSEAKNLTSRSPVVVIVGHVDHGKTTLLDYIRKTRVAEKEKGGITQHLGAYQVPTSHGNLIFLDTPGHEAFGLMRKRGLKVADIAILVVAADDGIMPQTIEAIKLIKESNTPMVVAINKMDRADSVRIEKLKAALSKYGVLSEEWGGDVVMLPISAKFGTNVDELLEMVALQGEVLELGADSGMPAEGFLLESQTQQGIGNVATFLAVNGTLNVGDYFIAGETSGRVNLIIDSHGSRIKNCGPAVPVKISGFDSTPKAGDMLKVISHEDYKRLKKAPIKQGTGFQISDLAAVKLIIKSDTESTREAIIGALEKLLKEKKQQDLVQVVASSIGDVTERDASVASSTGAKIYCFNVKVEPNAQEFAKANKIDVKRFDIIYRLLEDVEELAQASVKVEAKLEKVGEAMIKKVFDVKKIGKIAGFGVRQGKMVKGAAVEIVRFNKVVGKGTIKSLQKDKKTIKEVGVGFEGAMMVDGFDDWIEDDKVVCYLDSNQM